ncbi:hypothetical protein PAXRUDRAFT_17415 [Paxillus rubicundulus Ve08.2h10]|uniref:Unplaced genomic scaffold scaffold_2107, whole genome shotgun sequence n=1 Tax=Paxillus rubicundulus Ve08.2h10 TaxID=930991 RepID=A0A0D0CQD0_9AGAM|nr:hypothetical protein PAXRUDRAFT_17415 [Paxillus rubicundulus Ve08.2h10]
MSSSTTNDLTKWSDEQLRENEDEDEELFEKKSAERRHCMKVEEEAKQKAEVEAQRRAEAEAKACAEEVTRVQVSSVVVNVTLTELLGVETELGLGPIEGETAEGDSKRDHGGCGVSRRLSPMLRMLGPWGGVRDEGGREQQGKCERLEDAQPSRQRKQEEVMSPRAGKKKARMKSPVAEDKEEDAEDCKVDAEDCKVEENRDALAEVLSAMVGEMRNMAADRRCTAAESHAQMERVLGTLEEIWGCLDPEFVPEEGSEENFNEGDIAEAAEEREALKGQNEEEEEVDESV